MYPSTVGDCTVEVKFKKETYKSVPFFFFFLENARISEVQKTYVLLSIASDVACSKLVMMHFLVVISFYVEVYFYK